MGQGDSHELMITEDYGLSIDRPTCVDQFGRIRISATNPKNPFTVSLDDRPMSNQKGWTEVGNGDHMITIADSIGEITVDFIMMPEEDIGFDFVDVFPADCSGENGRIVAAITGSGSSGTQYTGSGSLFFNSMEFMNTIDVIVDAGEYTLSAVLNEDIRKDTLLIVAQGTCEVYIPNVITRSSLSGNNGMFEVLFDDLIQPFITDYLIYDRWGNLIYKQLSFSAVNYDQWWDGNCSGSPCAVGVYSYFIRIEFEDGTIEDKSGTVHLLD